MTIEKILMDGPPISTGPVGLFSGFQVSGLGLGFRVSGFRVQGFKFRIQSYQF